MNARPVLILAAAAVLVAVAAVWVSKRSGPERQTGGDRPVLASLADSLDSVSEVRLSRGDGVATTLQRRDTGWFVAQRNYPADPGKLRSLLINLSSLREVEPKTSDPARYATLGVEDASGPQSHSVRIEVVAGAHTWSLLLGKAAEPNGSFVRVSGQPAALSVQPRLDVDPQPARWILPQLLDVAADQVQRVAVRPAGGASYWLARDARGAPDLTLHGVPPGRKPASAAMLDGVAGVLARLNADDLKERATAPLEHPSQASYRTFDGLQLDLDGYREGTAAWIRVHASEDAQTARRFAPSQSSTAQGKETKASNAPGPEPKAAEAKSAPVKSADAAAQAAAINTRVQAFDFQIPSYEYDQIFRPLTDLLAPLPAPATKSGSKVH
jgi:hypothetical protein